MKLTIITGILQSHASQWYVVHKARIFETNPTNATVQHVRPLASLALGGTNLGLPKQ
jgi:hypothetical protein